MYYFGFVVEEFALQTVKISSSVTVENHETILPSTLASWEVDSTHYSEFELPITMREKHYLRFGIY